MPPVNAAQLMVTVGANTAAAEQGITGFARLLGPGGILGLGAIGAAAAIVGIGAASTKMAGDFQTSLTQLVTGAGESQSNLQLINDGVLQMSRDTGTSTKQLTDGLYMIESAGYHGQAGLDVLKAAAEGAKVGNADLGTTADAVTTIMKDYAGSGITAAQATNELIATVAQGKTHMQDLSGALASVLPTASAAGLGLNDVMAAMAAQTAAGIPAADAATHLRQMIIALQAPSAQSAKALEGIGMTTQQVSDGMKKDLPGTLALIIEQIEKKFPKGSSGYMQAIKEISGGSREMQGMLALTGDHMKDFTDASAKLAGPLKQGGDAITGWNLVQGTFNQKMSVLGETVKTLMISIGEKLLPVASKLVDMFSSALGPAVDALTGKGKDLSGAMGGLATVATDVSGATKGLSDAMGGLHGKTKPVSDFFKTDVQPIMKQLGDLWSTTIVPVLHTLADVFTKNILPAVEPVAKMFLEKVLPPMIRIYKDILPVLNPLLQAFGWVFQNIIGPALTQSMGLIGGILDLIANLADAISGFFNKPEVKKFFDLIGKGAGIVGGDAKQVLNMLPHFADGGVMGQTGLALVGEQGPELVSLPAGASVTPMSGVSGLSGSVSGLPSGAGGYGGGPITIIVHTNLDGRRVAENQVKYLPSVVRNATGARGF